MDPDRLLPMACREGFATGFARGLAIGYANSFAFGSLPTTPPAPLPHPSYVPSFPTTALTQTTRSPPCCPPSPSTAWVYGLGSSRPIWPKTFSEGFPRQEGTPIGVGKRAEPAPRSAVRPYHLIHPIGRQALTHSAVCRGTPRRTTPRPRHCWSVFLRYVHPRLQLCPKSSAIRHRHRPQQQRLPLLHRQQPGQRWRCRAAAQRGGLGGQRRGTRRSRC